MRQHGSPLTEAQMEYLRACVETGTTETEALAVHMGRSAASVDSAFRDICAVVEVHCRCAALLMALESGWVRLRRETPACAPN